VTGPSGSLKTLFDLTGRVAIVTGGSRGLGLQIAEALGEYGAKLLLVARKPGELAEAVAHLAPREIDAAVHTADLGQAGSAAEVVDAALAAFGRIDILVNNAGATWGAAAEDLPLEAWAKVLAVDLTGPFLLTQAVARRAFIPARKGRIINIASVEGLQGHHPMMTGTVAYNAAKGGLVNLTRALAAEWGHYGITVNAIAPGYFPSRMTGATLDRFEADLVAATPLGRLGGPQDLKGPALLFASDAGGHISGQILVVDGGALVI